jgi:hypothetical protein
MLQLASAWRDTGVSSEARLDVWCGYIAEIHY